MRFVLHGVMVGFVNALAILIFQVQRPELDRGKPAVCIMVAIALTIIYVLLRFTTVVPLLLVAIVLLTAASINLGLDVPTIGKGELPTALTAFILLDVPLNLETLDFTHVHLWDQSAVEAIDKIALTFRRNGIETQLIGINEVRTTLLDKLAVHDKDSLLQGVSLH